MVRVPLPLLAALALACHPPWPDTALEEGDADVDADADADGDVDNPPIELCSDTWGEIHTSLTEDRDGNVHWVTPGNPQGLIFYIDGQVDLCDMGCSADWVTPYYITDSKAYQNEIPLPLRLTAGVTVWAYFNIDIPSSLPDSDEHCWVETSLGKRWMALYVRS